MANKRPMREEFVTKLRQVEVLTGQGMPRPDAILRLVYQSKVFVAGVRVEIDNRTMDGFCTKRMLRSGHGSIAVTQELSERERAIAQGRIRSNVRQVVPCKSCKA